MDFFVNELSLHGQFESVNSFLPAIKQVVKCKEVVTRHSYRLYCLRTITERPVTADSSFRQVVKRFSDQNLIRLIMSWLDKHGPFLDDTWQRDPDQWFEYMGEVITDNALGEAVWRKIQNLDSALLSFQPSHFLQASLSITWQRNDLIQDAYELLNFWEEVTLAQYCLAYRKPVSSWVEMLARLRTDYPGLIFLESILLHLAGEPFSLTIAKHTEDLISILNKLRLCFNDQGTMTADGHTLIQDYFHGNRALFTDESDSNKDKFHREMSFVLPYGESLFCPFHGKIKHRQFRIHFSWPIRYQEPVYIAYIGPKITKG